MSIQSGTAGSGGTINAQMDIGGARQTGEIRKLTSLLEVSQALPTGRTSRRRCTGCSRSSRSRTTRVRSAVALAAGDRRRCEVVASSASGRDRMADAGVPGGALARQVVTSGRPVVVPRISREPALGRAASRRATSGRSSACRCSLNRRATGVLCVELRFKAERNYERTGKFFGVVASMIAQAIKVQRLLEAERERPGAGERAAAGGAARALRLLAHPRHQPRDARASASR